MGSWFIKNGPRTVFNYFFHVSEISLPVCRPKMSQNWCGQFWRAWGGRTRLILIKKSAFGHIWHLIFKETVANRRRDKPKTMMIQGTSSPQWICRSVLTSHNVKYAGQVLLKKEKEDAIIDFRINFRHLVERPTTQDGLHDHDQWVLRFRWGL